MSRSGVTLQWNNFRHQDRERREGFQAGKGEVMLSSLPEWEPPRMRVSAQHSVKAGFGQEAWVWKWADSDSEARRH